MNFKSLLTEKIILSEKKLFEVFNELSKSNIGSLFTYFNQNSFNHCYSNKEFQNILVHFNVYQEGIGLYLALKFLGFTNVDRIDSTEVHKNYVNKLISDKQSIIFIGGRFDEIELIEKAKNYGLNIEFYHHGYFDKNHIGCLLSKIKEFKSRYIFIGMTTPKQEFLAYELSRSLYDKVFVCVGNFFNYFLGYQKRAPKFIRILQLEWFYRLLQEPTRLFKRYVIGIPIFIWRIFKLRLIYNKLS